MKGRHLSVLLFSIGLLIILIVHWQDYVQSKSLLISFREVEASHDKLTALSNLSLALKDVQRSHRGYVLTGKQEFLAPYENAHDEIPTILQNLNAKFTTAAEQILIDSLSAKINRKIFYVERAIMYTNQGKNGLAINDIPAGKKLFDEMNAIILQLNSKERSANTLLQKKAEDNGRRNIIIVITGLLASGLLMILSLITIYRSQKKIEQLGQTLEEKNKELKISNEELHATMENLEINSKQLERTRNDLHYREKQLLMAQKLSKTGSLFWEPATDAIHFTEQFGTIFSLPPNQHYQFSAITGRVHPADVREFQQKITTAVKSNMSITHPFRLEFEGRTKFVIAIFEPYIERDEVKGYLGTVTDVTERHLALEELRSSETKFRALLDAAPDAMIIASGDGTITLVNKQTTLLFEFSKEELVGKNLDLLIPASNRNPYSNQKGTYVEHPRANSMGMGMNVVAHTKFHKEIHVEVMVSPLHSNEGVLLIAAIRDVSAQKQAEQRVVDANKKLEAANLALQKMNNELNDFSYSISHDLRAPLRAINGYSALLKEDFGGSLGENANRALGIIQRNADRMDALINDLLELAHLGTKSIEKQQANMRQIIDACLADKPIKPSATITIGAMPIVAVDPSLIRQVWENLISNAIKFSSGKEKPEITITHEKLEHSHQFSIKDNGVGFNPAYQDKLFKVFSRLHAKHEFEGTGAGLAISRKIVEAHGGQIWAEAKPDEGATFYFTLPL